MPNSLTGDFEAVLQISGGVVNRLLAGMHQNAFKRTDLPSFPHVISLRTGDDYVRDRDGVRGHVHAQLGAPRIELLHGSTTRFRLEVGVRARYRADPGATPMAEFIHGTVTADYDMEDVPAGCLGWHGIASKFVWIRVAPDSIEFRGNAFNQSTQLVVLYPDDPDEIKALITRRISLLLMTRFEAAPHRVSRRFRPGSIRSLAMNGQSAIATALGVDGGEPAGNIASVNGIFLDGAGFAVALARDVILRTAEPALAAISGAHPTIQVHIDTTSPLPDIDTVYRVYTNTPSLEWQPSGAFAILKVKFSGGANTDSILPNLTFEVEQDMVLNFDGGAGRLTLTAGATAVFPHVGGPFGGIAEGKVKQPIADIVKGIAQSAAAQAQPSLDAVIHRKSELDQQLRTFDDQAGTSFDSAEFNGAGMVLRGTVFLTHLRRPQPRFELASGEDAFTALQSWIPGGNIEQFRWSWTWYQDGTPGNMKNKDMFLLRRPEIRRSIWGRVIVEFTETIPLPGLDGMGRICLEIRGVQTESGNGELAPVTYRTACTNFGLKLVIFSLDYLLIRVWPKLDFSQPGPLTELAVIDTRTLGGGSPAANTLVISVGEKWAPGTGEFLAEALAGSIRRDAGLSVVVLFADRWLTQAGPVVAAEIQDWGLRWGTPVLVNEDVNGSWTEALGLPQSTGGLMTEAWRLVSPTGGVTWMSHGRPTASDLAAAFDECLYPSSFSPLAPVHTNVRLGLGLSASALHPGFTGLYEQPQCPPVPLGRTGAGITIVGFAIAGSASSVGKLLQLNSLKGKSGEDPPFVVAVLSGASAEEARQLREELDLGFDLLPDESRTITRNFGIGLWPTSVTLDSSGIVTGIDEGLHPQSEAGTEE